MKFSHYIGYIFGIFGSIASIASILLCKKDCITNVIFHNLIYIVFLILSLAVIFYLVNSSYKYKKYYDAYPLISVAFNSLHVILNPDIHNDTDLDSDLVVLQDFCSKLSETFNNLSGHNTAVCIKLLRNIGDRPDLFNLIRDRSSANSRPSGERDTQDEVIHYLSENSDFRYIFDESINLKLKNKFFLCNDLCAYEYYRNTRIDYDNFPPENKWYTLAKYLKSKHWPLPYRSSLVVPIIPLTEDKIGTHKLEGFLCVDSDKKGAFDERDVDIMRGVADGMYATMRTLRQKHFNF